MTEAEKDRQYAQVVRRFIAKHKVPSIQEIMYLVDDGHIPATSLLEELYTIAGTRKKIHPSQILGPESMITAEEASKRMAEEYRTILKTLQRKKGKKRH
tara:strand:+ start:132 stop:428 length:297 start_codon:yes stop_codon:yes gene_type:complete